MKPTQEQVIAWARESHMQSHHARDVWAGHIVNLENVAAFAYEAGRKDENEACAKVCENGTFLHDFSPEAVYSRACARAIRARGQV
jgi:hypothetical protein